MNIQQPTTLKSSFGTATAGSGVVAAAERGDRRGLQIWVWEEGTLLNVGFGSTPVGRDPELRVTGGTIWEPPTGLVPQQSVYVEAVSGSVDYQVIEFI